MRALLVFLALFNCLAAHKILVYNPKYAHSHSNFLGNIADILVDAGHDVTSLIPEIAIKLKDGTTKSKIVRVPPHPEAAAMVAKLDTGEIDLFSFSELNPIAAYIMSRDSGFMFGKQCEATLDSGVVEKLQKENLDLYIVESSDVCGMMLAHLLKPRSIIKTSTTILMGQQLDELGVPKALSCGPSMMTRSLDVHSFYSRAWNIYAEWATRLMFSGPRTHVNKVIRERFGAEFPTLEEISSRVAYVFTNTEPLIDFAVPTLSRVIDIGGLGAKEPKELDEYWSSVMNRRSKVVLISFGSMAKSYLLSPAVKDSILKMASSFPSVTFIWKYEKKDEFALGDAAKIDNLVLTDWMPQNDLLNHPNLTVFITHGGMGSVQELALRGKPAILIPIFGDQPRNAAMMEHNRLGKVLSKLEVGNHVKLIALLKELMENPEYAENSRRVARMLANKPFSSKEKLLKYVDFAAEFGPSSSLRPQSYDMSFIEYHNIDIILVSLIVCSLIAFVTMRSYSGFLFGKQCVATIYSGVVDKLQKVQFGLYIVETSDVCGMMLAHLLKPRSIIKTSTTILMGQQLNELGVPEALSYGPSMLTRSLDVHSFYSRFWNIYAEWATKFMFSGPRTHVNKVIRDRFGAAFPTLEEISSNVAYVFTNTEPLIDFAAPTLSRVVDIGGLGAKEPKELDEYWSSVMTRRSKVVLISFGSMAKSYLLSPAVKNSILKMAFSFPSVTFIWKYDRKDEFAQGDTAKIDNLVLTVLTDRMTYSTTLFLPFSLLMEAWVQCKSLLLEENHVLSKLEVGNHVKMIVLLKELMENPEYAENSRRVARMLANKPFSSKEKLLKYVDFAAEFGPSSSLRPQSQDMSYIEYHNLDIILTSLIVCSLIVFVSVRIVCGALKKVYSRKAKNDYML